MTVFSKTYQKGPGLVRRVEKQVQGVTAYYEYPDGSGGSVRFLGFDAAEEWAFAFGRRHPECRVWVGDDVVQFGFRASDDGECF